MKGSLAHVVGRTVLVTALGFYPDISDAFEKLIAPHIDSNPAENIFEKDWLPDNTQRVTNQPDPG